MTKTKTKWVCIYTPPLEEDTETHGDNYFAGQRLFIEDDPKRIYVVDNSGDNPDECCDGRVEIDLSRPGVIGLACSKTDKIGYGADFGVVGGNCTVRIFPWEAVVMLAEKWGATLTSDLPSDLVKDLRMQARALKLARKGSV